MKMMRKVTAFLLACVMIATSIQMDAFADTLTVSAQNLDGNIIESDINEENSANDESVVELDTSDEEVNDISVETVSGEKVSALDGKAVALVGEGTAEQPYEIGTVEELASLPDLLEKEYDKYGMASYILTDDIDGTAYEKHLVPIGSEEHPFAGNFDGNGKVIRNFDIGDEEKDYQGLFGVVGKNGHILNLGIIDIEVEGKQIKGLLCSIVYGTVENVYNYSINCKPKDSISLVYKLERGGSLFNIYSTLHTALSQRKDNSCLDYVFYSIGNESNIDDMPIEKMYYYGIAMYDEDFFKEALVDVLNDNVNKQDGTYNWMKGLDKFPVLIKERKDKEPEYAYPIELEERVGAGKGRGFLWPLPGYSYCSSGVGWRGTKWHAGIDLPAPCNTPIYATKAGRVYIHQYDTGGYGWYLVINHCDGTWSLYGHMNSYAGGTGVGNWVQQGQTIGYVGNTGGSKGNHLHFEIHEGNRFIFASSEPPRGNSMNPYNYVNEGDTSGVIIPPTPVAPSKPSLNCESNVGKNTTFQVSCSASGTVTGYRLTATDASGATVFSTSGGGTLTAKLPNTGTYTLHAVALNGALASGETTRSITVKDDVKVTFADWNGAILKNETAIPYGTDAVAPVVAERTGYNFTGWSSSVKSVKEDTLFTAQYSKKKYTVKFYLEDGVTLLSAQTVEYGDAAIEPEYPEDKLRTGYVFESWSQKTDFIDNNMKISPVIAWGNIYLPVVATIKDAKKVVDPDDTNSIVGYTVDIHMVCTPDSLTKGRAVVSLKTANGKMVASTESAAFYIFKDSERDLQVFVPYEDVVTKLEVIIVDGYSLNTPYSAPVVHEIPDDTQEWSGWKEGTPEEGYRDEQIEYRTEYSYRDKQFITTANAAMTGWELLSSSEGWSDYGAWSGWQDNAVGSNDTTKVETRQVQNSGAYTQYNYYGYNSYNASVNYKWTHFCPVAARNYYGGTWQRCESGWTNTYVGPTNLGQNHGWGCSCGNPGGAMVQYAYGGWKYYYCQTRTIPATYKTQYRYATRSWQTKNTFWKWGDYTDWSPEEVTASDTREVETRRVYRTFGRIIDMEDSEDITRTISGNLSSELAGKQLILMVYKVDEASDYSNEYVGQTVIGENGEYSFEFITREEPSVKTGDFTVALSIEGSTAPVYLESIKAPKKVYTVAFEDWNGNPIGEEQQVTEGENAVSPEEPSREGYYFAGWDTGLNNVHYDMIVTAKYKPELFTIIYKDWDGSILDIQQTGFEEKLTPPALVGDAERSYTGWDIENAENYIVHGDMTLTAQSVINKYTVNFYQENGALIKTEEVEYGSSATPPSEPVRANSVFEGWSEDGAYSYVTGDLDLYPVFSYTDTTEKPVADIKSGIYSNVQEISLTCATSGANIYYTLDGDDPYYEGELYSGPIKVDSDTQLRMVATRLEMNDSDEVVCNYKMQSPLLISNCTIENIPEQTYSGKAITPKVIVADHGKKLVENEQYTVSYSNNISVGAATVIVKGIGLYEGSVESDFCIVNSTSGKLSLAGAKIGKAQKVTYNGQSCRPSVSVKMNGKKLAQYSDYQIAYKNNINAGTATATIIGCGFYCGTKTVEFTILPTSIKKASVSGLEKVTDLDGKAKGVEAVVTINGQILAENTDYIISYRNNTKAGKATVFVNGINNYKGKLSKRFKIGRININECVSSYDGEIKMEYTGSKIKPGAYLVYDSYELEEGKDYTIQYVNNLKIGQAGMIIKGKGNYEGRMEKRFSIVARNVANLWDVSVKDVQYNGSAQEAQVQIKNSNKKLKKNRDFYMVCSDNIEKGTATLTIYGKGNYCGEAVTSFRIVDQLITNVKISKIPDQNYTGKALEPDVTVELKGKTLTPDVDFMVTYQKNIDRGMAEVIITGINEYGGNKTVKFRIK